VMDSRLIHKDPYFPLLPRTHSEQVMPWPLYETAIWFGKT
jgi:hypothetical protein